MAADGHATADNVVTPDGGVTADQVAPSLAVTMMEATWPPSSPTATQVAVLAVALGAHETALTLARGGDVAVICQVALDVAEAAGSGAAASMTTAKDETTIIVNAATVIPRNVRTSTSLRRGEPAK
jgi:hypothetical protein